MPSPTPQTRSPEHPSHDCQLCPRLAGFRDDLKVKEPDWFNGPVPSFGDPEARLLIVGLAPGMHGAHRTGRPFTGDWAGDLLYATIAKFGFSRGDYQARIDDGLVLTDAMITNAVRCLPPQNKPVGAEIAQCRPFLEAQIDALPNLQVMILLGKIAHDSTMRTLGLKLKDHSFGHAAHYRADRNRREINLLSSYHCSRYNTNTKRLTPDMFETVFAMAKAALS